jgi:hypothetical protein
MFCLKVLQLLSVVPWEKDIVTEQNSLYGQRASEKKQKIRGRK